MLEEVLEANSGPLGYTYWITTFFTEAPRSVSLQRLSVPRTALPSGLRTCQQTGHVAESEKMGSNYG